MFQHRFPLLILLRRRSRVQSAVTHNRTVDEDTLVPIDRRMSARAQRKGAAEAAPYVTYTQQMVSSTLLPVVVPLAILRLFIPSEVP